MIPEYTERSIFTFKVKHPEELFSMEDSLDYIVFRDETDLKSIIYTPLAVDANGTWNYKNQLNFSENTANGWCNVSFVIDEGFLKDSETKYPVRINQSINVYKHKQPDTAVYSETGDMVRHYLSPYMLLGDKTVKGEGWGLIRYEVLYDLDIPEENIISADYCFANLFDIGDEITIGSYAVINDWCSVTTTWKNKPVYDKVSAGTVKVKDRGAYSIDITELFKKMIEGKSLYESPYSVRNSFLIKSNTKNSNLILASGDSGIYSPYLKIVITA